MAKKPKRERVKLKRNKPVADRSAPVRHLSKEVSKEFCRLARKGIPASTIVDYLGIPASAFHEWLAKAKSFDATNDPNLAVYGQFVRNFKRACARYLIDRQALMETGDPKEYYREVVILERRDRKNWGKIEQAGGETEAYDPDEKFI